MDDAALPAPVDEVDLPDVPAAAPVPPTTVAASHEQAAGPSHEDAAKPDASVPPAAAAPAPVDPADEWNVDLSDAGWTYDRLLAAAQLSQNGYDWVADSVLTRDHLVRATVDPRPDLDLSLPKPGGGGGGRKASTKGRLVADVVEAGQDAFVTALSRAVELPAGACMALFQGVEINLERLFHIVAAHGGSDAVRVGRQWTAVADAVTPTSGTGATRGLVHRQAYETLLLAYEQLLDARGEYAPLCVRCKGEHSDVVQARRAATARGRPRKGSGSGQVAPRPVNACEVCGQRHSGIVWLFQCDWCERLLCQTCGFGDDGDDFGPDGQKAHKCVDCAKGDTNRAFCEACRGDASAGQLFSCHSCPASYHASCVDGPPPAGEWLCPSCSEGGNEAGDALEALALMDALAFM